MAVGGYAGVPCGLAAAAARVPLVVVEQNAVPGAANRLLGRFARASAVSFPGTDLPGAVVTGNPVRPEILAVDRSAAGRAAARAALGLPEGRRVIAVTGGSLGALRINRAVLGAVEQWAGAERPGRPPRRRAPGTGRWCRPSSRRCRPTAGASSTSRCATRTAWTLLLAAADLLVCRAGGNTVAEVAVVGLPAVLVPLPNAPGDHQTANARALADAGAAVLVPDGELDADRLVAEVERAAGRRRPAGGDGPGGGGRGPARRRRPGGRPGRGARPPVTERARRRRRAAVDLRQPPRASTWWGWAARG